MECYPERVDFFRRLPESLSHQILGLLGIKDLARVSTLSRQCRKLCLSSPSLTIDLGYLRDDQEFVRFSAFLQRFMSLRNGVGIHQLEVVLGKHGGDDYGDGNQFLIHDWILKASLLNVEKICLDLVSFKFLNLPRLTSACLRDLEVSLGSECAMLNFPTTSFGGLENLKLRYLQVSNEFGKWISSCKSLKMLYLQEVDGMDELNINSSSLEYLTLEDMPTGITVHHLNIKVSAKRLKYMHVEVLYSACADISLTFHAPKLEQLFLSGSVTNYSCEGNLESLEHSHICIDNDNHEEIIGKVLQSVYRVSSMYLDDYSIKEISPQPLLPVFCNLRSLTLKRTYFFDGIPSIASLLNLMPHLDTLQIEGFRDFIYWSAYAEEKCYNAEHWESQNLKFVHSLKELEMEINGLQNELELVKYFLKNAKALKTLTIHYSQDLGHRQSEISRKIQQFQIASSSIALYFFYD